MLQKIFIANWKMNKSFKQELDFCSQYRNDLAELNTKHAVEIVVCPSFTSLHAISHTFRGTKIGLGAQQCSAYEKGAYTGQVSAQSLQEIGCTYCIVGHSEQRIFGTTHETVAQQAALLLHRDIKPVICIGETKIEYEKNIVFEVLEKQLAPLAPVIQKSNIPFIIGYEPVWSIGSGLIPSQDHLEKVYAWLATWCTHHTHSPWRLIYGGSVDEKTVQSIKQIQEIAGYLIGGASLDFQKFQKIVLLAL